MLYTNFMLDIEFIRSNRAEVEAAAKNKNVKVNLDELLKLDQKRRDLLQKTESLRHERNQLSGSNKGQKPSNADIKKGQLIKNRLEALEKELDEVEASFKIIMLTVPNVPLGDVPIGKTEAENVVTKTVGQPRKFDFEAKNHWEIAEPAGLIDKERAAKVAGARFAYIQGGLVRLHFALIQFGLDTLGDETILKKIAKSANLDVSTQPFVPVLPPAIAKTNVYEATARLNGEETTYKLASDDLWLNASAEHTLCPMYMNEILAESSFPLRYVGYTTAFRREAGSYGKDMEGIFRLHQFDKLEMESFTTAELGLKEHLFMVAIQEYLTQQLELPYQVIQKCTADIGAPNARGIDIDTWLPGQNKYRETHTADYMTDYQARRLQTRVRRTQGNVELVHTNDATVFSQRPLIAIVENYQTKDGRVEVPKVLQKYMGSKFL
jgi:seryl-tRNA synthetase